MKETHPYAQAKASPQVTANQSNGRNRRAAASGGAEPERALMKSAKSDKDVVTWRSLPHRRQLAVLTLARLAEPLVQTSLQAYMFYQLKSFDETLSDSVIATQAGLLASSFTGAQFLTAMLWGRISDSEYGGRKMVVLIGLFGTMLSVLGFGFSTSFSQAVVFRLLGGALNGNLGVMRTMISEIVQEKKYQSRAFLLFPICFNIGVIIGPIMGGLLADPAKSYPSIFGHVQWMKKYPYAAPNIISAMFLFCSFSGVFFFLKETLDSIRHKEDFGTKCARYIQQYVFRKRKHDYSHAYTPINGADLGRGRDSDDLELSATSDLPKKAVPRWKNKLPFRRMFTPNVLHTLFAHTLMAIHLGAFNNLWFVFLSTPVADPDHPNPPSYKQRLPFVFTGGLGMPPRDVGLAMAILGVIGIAMQLLIYPYINTRFGTIRSWRVCLYCFPVAYLLAPFLSLVPSKTPPPAEKDGVLVWICLCVVLFFQVTGRTFALPATTILVNNASPHPSILGTMHGIGQSLSSGGRALGPTIGGALYGVGLRKGVVGGVWWLMSLLALVNCVASLFVREGDGHEIWLEGDKEAEEEFEAASARPEHDNNGSRRVDYDDRARSRSRSR